MLNLGSLNLLYICITLRMPPTVYLRIVKCLMFNFSTWSSYDRIQPNTWSGAYYCWGKENREAPIRTSCPPGVASGVVSNFEMKSFDGCANPHLGLASIVAAGIDGLRRNLTLPRPIGMTQCQCYLYKPVLNCFLRLIRSKDINNWCS